MHGYYGLKGFMSILREYVSKEASIADWLAGLGTFLVTIIALWPNFSRIFSRLLFPKCDVRISGSGNFVISRDGKIHKLQIPLQIENKGFARIFIESIQLQLKDPGNGSYDLSWRKFIRDITGSATAPVSNPYRFLIDPKGIEDKFIEFLTEEDITVMNGNYIINIDVVTSYFSKTKRITLHYICTVTDNLIQQILINAEHARSQERAILIGIQLNSSD